MNTQIVKYSNTTLAAGALHMDLVSGRDELKTVSQKLQPGTEVIVKFLFVANLQGRNSQIYHAATAKLDFQAKKLGITASIGTYVDGAYQDQLQLEGEESCFGELESAAQSQEQQIIVRRYPL